MSTVSYLKDGLKNLVANLGTDRDKRSHSYYGLTMLTDEELVSAYRSAWLPRKIVDVVPEDACRRWRSWQATAEQITKIEALEKALNVRGHVLDAMKKARLFGGAAVYIGTDAADPMKPMRTTETLKHLTVISKPNLPAGDIDRDPSSPTFGKPSFYQIANSAVKVHPSRLVIFVGAKLPDEDLATAVNQKGWGDSVLMPIMDALTNADSTVANVASLVFEAKVDVIKIPDFMANLEDPEYEKQVLSRVSLAARAKGINGALLIDSEEDYQQKSANFSSLKDILMAMMQIVSGASDIPMTRLLGMSPGGMQSTGESDTRNYYDHVSSIQELQMAPAMGMFDELLINNALGSRPPEVWYQWQSLWQLTDSEKAEIGSKTADTIKKLSETNLFDDDALSRASVNVLVERGVMPGLDQNEGDLEDDESDRADTMAALSDGVARPLYVSRRVLNTKDIRRWAESQGFSDIHDDLHVTVAYSKDPVDWMAVSPTWDQGEDGNLRIAPGGPRDIDRYGDDSIVIEFKSNSLSWRHTDFIDAGASWDWPEYKPHISVTTDATLDLTTIKPYTGPIVLGPEIFEDLT